ncbi:glycoside hydrolase [Jimgerdemannia flammicorona]|uniref:Glycoside hydrolase n=1 Tax=Jimgerdemannia flammicorona TaxID=994334 RepID=A0A433DHU9_9FUNG|nr:glycoside hydrolase [Jimgerdemannia flammicorona]
MISLLTNLRATFDSKYGADTKDISLAVNVQPFIVNGVPSTNLSAFVPLVNRFKIMAYDIFGSWSIQTGPNAPFNAVGGEPFGFAVAAQTWIKASVPAGLSRQRRRHLGDSDDTPWADPCGLPEVFSSIWKWKNLRNQEVLTQPDKAGVRTWDEAGKTPWLFNSTTMMFISYDDPDSLKVNVDLRQRAELGRRHGLESDSRCVMACPSVKYI